mmetsp:Transcript_11261/g.17268  ORF Transcript_11261/g.17268 Transcript_11261/m.17268 type:complete len:118 (+) Transcript_11261:167-520(+)
MAGEIVRFWEARGNSMPLTVFLPGGTCTTAMLLSREINAIIKRKTDKNCNEQNLDIIVGVIPCVGDGAYAEATSTLHISIAMPLQARKRNSIPLLDGLRLYIWHNREAIRLLKGRVG